MALLTKDQAAEELGTSVRHVERLIFERRIPFVKLGTARNAPVRIDATELAKWVRSHTVAAER